MTGALKICMLISLTLHVAVFAVPGINFSSLLPPPKETKLIEVSLMKNLEREDLSPFRNLFLTGPEKEISQGEVSPIRKNISNGVKDGPPLEEIQLAGDEIKSIGEAKLIEFEESLEEKPNIVKEVPADFLLGETPPQRIVDFQGYPPEAVQAVFERYGMRYERYSAELKQATTSNLVKAFTLDKEQLTGDGGSSAVTFSGRPKPGIMVLVIPAKVYLAILEAEREELRRRGSPLNTPLKKVVFGIGRDSQGGYAITVRELILYKMP